MTQKEIAGLRLINQRIIRTEFTTVPEIVRWMGAMQAQDFVMSARAAGMRFKKSSIKKFLEAFNSGSIIRTHLMRPTWHLVNSADVRWMLELTAPQIKRAVKTRHNHFGYTSDFLKKTNRIIEKALDEDHFLSREDLARIFEKEKIRMDENRLAHMIMIAELDGVICSGPIKNGKPTWALLDERVPVKNILNRDESLAELAKRYYSSHGPATVRDFSWWSGLNLTDARKAINLAGPGIQKTKADSVEYYIAEGKMSKPGKDRMVQLLPAYDEYIIGYADRSATVPEKIGKSVISRNGIFYPVVIINGIVSGLWRMRNAGEKMKIEVNMFAKTGSRENDLIEEKAMEIGKFYSKKAELKVINEVKIT